MWLFVLHCFVGWSSASSISKPLVKDADIGSVLPDYSEVKPQRRVYHNTTLQTPLDIPLLNYRDHSCNIDFHLSTSQHLASPIFAPPIVSSTSNGKPIIFASTLSETLEAIGYNGARPWGWPLHFTGASFLSSPLLYDVNGDGVDDIGIVDTNANLYWIRLGDFGQYLEDYHISLPKLRIKKNWADHLDANYIDNYILLSMFDNPHDGDESRNTQMPEKKAVIDELNVPFQDTYPEQRSFLERSRSRKLQAVMDSGIE